jgi:2-methylcitrate dehydratase PrpD
MTYRSLPGTTARMGLQSALLASKDFTSGETILEGPKGFAVAFGTDADPAVATASLGAEFEILSNTYKPYPCGIVVHPIIDVCLDLARGHDIQASQIERVELGVHPLAMQLANRRTPENRMRAGTSMYHWAAVSFLYRQAGLRQGADDAVHNAEVIDLRNRVTAEIDDSLGSASARATVYLKDGSVLAARVGEARGSAERPMTDADLDEKFMGQAGLILDEVTARRVLEACWHIEECQDVGAIVRRFFQ